MNTKHGLAIVSTLAACASLGCAARNDQKLVESRENWLSGRREQPSAEREGQLISLWPAGRAPAEARAAPSGDGEATSTRPRAATLDAYLELGLAHSARLRAAFEEWRASAETIEQASALPDPRLTYVEFLEEIQTRTGPQQRKFGLAQSFPWPGQLGAKGRLAEHQAERMWAKVESARLQVVRDIEVAYHQYAFASQEIRITRELVELLHGLEPVVQSRVRAGAGQENLLRLQVEIGRLEDELASFERRQPALAARIAEAMSVPTPTDSFPLPVLQEPAPREVDIARAREQALSRSPSLRVLGEELLVGHAAEELSHYQDKPSFTLGIDYFETGEALNPDMPGSGDDPVSLSLSLSLPLQRSSYSAARREARHRVQATRRNIEAEQLAVFARIEEEAVRMDDAARRIVLYRDSLLPRANESLQLTLAAYRTGAASLLDLIDTERALLEFQLSFWRACREYWIGDARLRAVVGDEVTL